ncbi:MAG: hypothetical protein ACREIR_08980 [Geminicoccaceae bacterium]
MTPGLQRAALALVLCGIGAAPAAAGHSLGHYPSYYPDEIRIDLLDPAAAGRGLGEGTLHAYVGAAPAFKGPVPEHVRPVTSLGSFLVLAFDGAAPGFASSERRCAAARGILSALREAEVAGFVFHPYPVTPYHADYLHHLDRIEAARRALADAAAPAALRIRAEGEVAAALVRERWTLASDQAEVSLTEAPVAELIASGGTLLNDGLGPPWMKEGWVQAHQLLAPPAGAGAPPDADEAGRLHARLMRGEVVDLAEHVNLERRLIAALTRGCTRMVVGYTKKAEYANARFSDGIENIAFDSQSGLDAPVFLRTVKLKSYPWNGSLHLGVPGRAEAAWNPVAGFTDATGRLIWSAVADPAMIPFPFNASWIPNRIDFEASATHGQSGGVRVPLDAVLPQLGTGALEPVAAWTFASAKVLYEVLASPFQDGTEMAMADLVYPFVFAYRWGGAGPDGKAREPRLQTASADVRDRLAGLRALRVESTDKSIAEGLDVVQNTPVLEVYLRDAPGDEHQVAALAPPWSAVPWHLLALMEAAVQRGHAAFSREEARRRRVGWLDLVRDRPLQARLRDLIAAFEREGYRPDALKELVSVEEARGPLAGARDVRRNQWAFPGHQRPLPAEGVDAGVGRAAGRARSDLSAGLRYVRPLRQPAAGGDPRGDAGCPEDRGARGCRHHRQGRTRLPGRAPAVDAPDVARAVRSAGRVPLCPDRPGRDGSRRRPHAVGGRRAFRHRPSARLASRRVYPRPRRISRWQLTAAVGQAAALAHRRARPLGLGRRALMQTSVRASATAISKSGVRPNRSADRHGPTIFEHRQRARSAAPTPERAEARDRRLPARPDNLAKATAANLPSRVGRREAWIS